MKKRMGSLFLGAMMVLLLAVPAFAAGDAVDVSGSSWCSCGGKMTESVHYTGWVTQQFVDCTHELHTARMRIRPVSVLRLRYAQSAETAKRPKKCRNGMCAMLPGV